jgi:hypothetical protein
MMKFLYQVLRVLTVVMVVCTLLSAPAQAQFSQQGPKLVATDALGRAGEGGSVSLSGDGNTAIVGGFLDNSDTAPRGCSRARAGCGPSKARNWLAQAP